MANQIWKLTAVQVVNELKKNNLSPKEVLEDLILRCESINKLTNSIPTFCFERAFEFIKKNKLSDAEPLYGLPIPIKDSILVSKVKSTYGSLAFKNFVPKESDHVVIKIEKSGGVIFGKTNTPEFEAGASTFNDVFGVTRNPWNLKKSVSGSSGGAASAVASGMAFISQGSDFACSIRYPSSFCGVVGLRPTPGLVPFGPTNNPYQTLSVNGPIARNVDDLGLGLDSMTGLNIFDPLTTPRNKSNFKKASEEPFKKTEVAFSYDLSLGPIESEVKNVFMNTLQNLEKNNMKFTEVFPDMKGSTNIFKTLRAYQFFSTWNDIKEKYKKILKPEVVWNIEEGSRLNISELSLAEKKRNKIRYNMLKFFEKNEFLITPTTPVVPFDAEDRYVKHINGIEMESYIDWLFLGFSISLIGCPSISIPCGFTKNKLPIGMQIITKPYNEYRLLSFCSWIEKNLNFTIKTPITP